MNATVYLVGAGPGDPDLLTLKALRLLQQADLVLHDDLVSPEILELVRPGALIQNVGKRCGRKHITQEEIHARMIGAAQSGQTVVRLKGGDPSLFGRAGEEMKTLREAGVDFEVVPGITAAFAAAASAKISLTERRLASRLIFLTAHSCHEDSLAHFEFGIASGSTLAIYMPGDDYAGLQEKLLRAGADPATPCIITSRVSQPGQNTYTTVLAELAFAPRALAPSIILIGPMPAAADHQGTNDHSDAPLESVFG